LVHPFDELIRVSKGAQNALLNLEELEEEELDVIRQEYLQIAQAARNDWRRRPGKNQRASDKLDLS